MTTDQKLIRTNVGLLELAKQLGRVSQACRMMGYSRECFYHTLEELQEDLDRFIDWDNVERLHQAVGAFANPDEDVRGQPRPARETMFAVA